MDAILNRAEKKVTGIFSVLSIDEKIFQCLEHAYQDGQFFEPKVPVGVYTCVRGKHRLHGMVDDFETFEITGVLGHSSILFHWGNYNKDSDGCVLLGLSRAPDAILKSREAFAEFMALQSGVSQFQLQVIGV